MTATTNDDDMVRTHDEAAQVLRWAVPGAAVDVVPMRPGPGAERARRYVVTLARLGHREVSRIDVYALPMRADALARRARELADTAAKAAEV